MIRWKSLFVLTVVGAALTACCCCPCEALFPEAEFTAGDFPDVPAYPGATQTTETSAAINALVTALSLIVEDGEWKHYTTDDSVSAVVDWYSDELPIYGWVEAEVEDIGAEGALFLVKATDPDTALYLVTVPDPEGGTETHIIVGRVRLPVEVGD